MALGPSLPSHEHGLAFGTPGRHRSGGCEGTACALCGAGGERGRAGLLDWLSGPAGQNTCAVSRFLLPSIRLLLECVVMDLQTAGGKVKPWGFSGHSGAICRVEVDQTYSRV
jgi:hypothetical protein